VHAGRAAADATGVGRETHDPEKWPINRHDHATRHLGGLAGAVDRNDPVPQRREFANARALKNRAEVAFKSARIAKIVD
jgi:hypothetical protein